MIYLLGIALVLTALGFAWKGTQKGFLTVTLDSIFAALAGFGAGIFIGIGARIGMSAITLFNSGAPQFTASGSFRVILFFSSFGIGLGLIYEILLRDLLRQRGLLYGIIITLITWYPLAQSGVQLLKFQPTIVSVIFFSGVFVMLIWLPFAFSLEMFLERWHRRSKNFSFAKPICKTS